jgi:hypothetical protein
MRTVVELVEELVRRLHAADAVLVGLAADMSAAGASSASERTERARVELHQAQALAEKVLRWEREAD